MSTDTYTDTFRAERMARAWRRSGTASNTVRLIADLARFERAALPDMDDGEAAVLAWKCSGTVWGVLTSRCIRLGSDVSIPLENIESVDEDRSALLARGKGGVSSLSLRERSGARHHISVGAGPDFWALLSLLKLYAKS